MPRTSKHSLVRCASCGKLWPSENFVCPDDQTPLEGATVLADVPDKPTLRKIASQPSAYEIDEASANKLVGGTATKINVPFDGSFTDATPIPTRPTMASREMPTPYRDLTATVIDEYQITAKIGQGAMGSVYAATHRVLGKRVAIKVINPELCISPLAVDRFLTEARAVAQLSHPNIVDVFAFGQLPDGRNYFVMEWLPGEALSARLARGRVQLGEALDILDQIAKALAAAHEQGVIHRDLKPDNIWLKTGDERPIVTILDFGLAKLQSDLRVERTQTGVILGTATHLSPEQARGKDVGPETDVYSLGCIAYELILGRLPFTSDNVAELIAAHLQAAPPRPSTLWPNIPSTLEALLWATLDKTPSRRSSLATFRHTLKSAHGAPGLATPPKRSSRRPLYIAGALACIFAGGFIATMTISTGVEAPTDSALVIDAGTIDSAVTDASVEIVVPIDAPAAIQPMPVNKPRPRTIKPKRDPRDNTIDVFKK